MPTCRLGPRGWPAMKRSKSTLPGDGSARRRRWQTTVSDRRAPRQDGGRLLGELAVHEQDLRIGLAEHVLEFGGRVLDRDVDQHQARSGRRRRTRCRTRAGCATGSPPWRPWRRRSRAAHARGGWRRRPVRGNDQPASPAMIAGFVGKALCWSAAACLLSAALYILAMRKRVSHSVTLIMAAVKHGDTHDARRLASMQTASSRRTQPGAEAGVAGVQSFEVGLALLSLLAHQRRPMKITELAAQAGMPPAKAHRYLASLVRSRLRRAEPGQRPVLHRAGRAGLQPVVPVHDRADRDRLRGGAWSCAAGPTTPSRCRSGASFGPTVVRWEQPPRPVMVNIGPGSVFPLLESATGRDLRRLLRRGRHPAAPAARGGAGRQRRRAARRRGTAKHGCRKRSSRCAGAAWPGHGETSCPA